MTSSQPHVASRPGLTLTVVSLSYLMLVMDLSIAVATLPLIQHDLHFSGAGLAWVQTAYMLSFGGFLLLGARLGDIYGRRRTFMIGLGAFALASLILGFAQSAEILIIGRLLQGLSAAVVAPSTLALLSVSFPTEPLRGRALAVYGSVTGSGTTLGLVLGGLIAGTLGWHWAFLINFPIGVALVILAPIVFTETERHSGRLDVLGAITSTIGMTGLVYGLVNSAEIGWGSPITLGCLAAGVLFLVWFVRHEAKAPNPLLPLRLLKNAQRNAANGARFLFVGSMAGFWFYGSQYLQNTRGLTPLETGLAFLPMTLASFAIAMFVPKLSKKFGNAPFLAGGLAVVMVGTFLLGFATRSSDYTLTLALPMMLIGLGQGASTIRLTSAGIANVEPKDSGAASGVVSVAVQLGSALGLSMLVALSSAVDPHGVSASVAGSQHLHTAMLGGAALIFLALASVVIWVLPKQT
ncbi:MAG: hypothetical protein RL508_720 [Actinomycetota bacterium]|jgi:EmrB/QacA subfamily drug resistance transporter